MAQTRSVFSDLTRLHAISAFNWQYHHCRQHNSTETREGAALEPCIRNTVYQLRRVSVHCRRLHKHASKFVMAAVCVCVYTQPHCGTWGAHTRITLQRKM